MPSQSWVEVCSSGDSHSTKVYLVIRDEAGDEVRYPIPNCSAVVWECQSQPRDARVAKLTLTLNRVHLRTSTPLRVDGLHVNDLLAEIAAGKLDKEDK